MRAIIRCITNVEPTELDGLLNDYGWIPNLAQDHPEILEKRSSIIDTVHETDRASVDGTFLYTIAHHRTRTWGIVSNPAHNRIEFRLKNPDSDRLKEAAEQLVADIQEISSKHSRLRQSNIIFTVDGKIEVLEPKGHDHAYFGDVLPQRRLSYAIRKRKQETWIGIIAAIFALITLIITLPPIIDALIGSLPDDWYTYWVGLLDRLGSSAIVTATVSLLSVVLYYLDVRRKPVVNWIA